MAIIPMEVYIVYGGWIVGRLGVVFLLMITWSSGSVRERAVWRLGRFTGIITGGPE
jgi:hypothetical protein